MGEFHEIPVIEDETVQNIYFINQNIFVVTLMSQYSEKNKLVLKYLKK